MEKEIVMLYWYWQRDNVILILKNVNFTAPKNLIFKGCKLISITY